VSGARRPPGAFRRVAWRDASLVDRPFKLAVTHTDNAKTVEKTERQHVRFWLVRHLTGITPGGFRRSPGGSPGGSSVSLATCLGNLPGFDDAAARPHPTPPQSRGGYLQRVTTPDCSSRHLPPYRRGCRCIQASTASKQQGETPARLPFRSRHPHHAFRPPRDVGFRSRRRGTAPRARGVSHT
jgi:hypothetical protein